MNPQMSFLLQLFAVLVVSASTAASSADPDHLLCSKTCNPLHHQVVYEQGQTYIYNVKLKTKIADQKNAQLKKALKITALADISVYTQCELILRLREVAVVTEAEEEEDNRLRLEQSLEAASTHFAYEDGKVVSICGGHEKMVNDKWVVDIKKTIISSLQMTSSDVAQKQSLMETDISGYCETLYSPLKSNNTKIIAIKKSKRMRKCAQQHQLNNNFYQTIFSSLLVDNSAIECTQMLEDQIIISVSCLSQIDHLAIKVSSHIEVQFIEKKPTLDVPRIEGQLISYPLTMIFKSSDHHHRNDVKKLLKQICARVQNSIQLDVPEQFYELTQSVNLLNVSEATQLWEQIKSGQICSSPKLTDLFLDALAFAGNEASAEVLIRAYQQQQISHHRAKYLFGQLAFAKNPTIEAAHLLVDFVKQQKQELVNVPRGIIFGVTGYLHNLQIVQQHHQNSKISDIVKLMEDTLVSAIQKQPQQAALPLVYALQNLFTTLRNQRTPNQPQIAQKIVEILKQTQVSQANQELRVALVKTVAKTLPPLDDDDICQFLTELVVNEQKQAEESIHVQIEAYKAVALSSCATQSKLLQIKQFTEQVATQPELVNYVRSHQNNLRSTSDYSKENLSLPVFGKPSDQYFGISRNYKLPYASKAFDITAEADVIYAAARNQFVRIPQTVSFNLNVPIDDGQKHQLVEVRLHQRGLERVIAHLLQDKPKCSNGLWKIVKETVLQVLQSTSEVLGSTLKPVIVSLQIAVDGKTVLLFTEHDLMSTGHVQEQLMAALKQPQIYLDRAFAISPLDTVFQLPSLGGVPLQLRVNSTVVLGLKTDLNLNLTNSNIRLAVYPSLASQLETSVEFQVGPEHTRSLVYAQNAYIAPFVDMKAEVTKGRLISFRVNLPDKKKYTVAQFKSQVYTRGQRAPMVSSKAIANKNQENPNCTMITKNALGVIFCYNFSEITLLKTDPKILSYEMTLELPYTIDELFVYPKLGKQYQMAPFKFLFNTPDSQIDRKIALEIELPKTDTGRRIKKAHFLIQIPWRQINVVMSIDNETNDGVAHIEFSIDNHKIGLIKLETIQLQNSITQTSTEMIVAVAGFETKVTVTFEFSNQQLSLKLRSNYKLPSWKQQEQIMVDFDVQKYHSNETILKLVNSGAGKMSQFPEYKVQLNQTLQYQFGEHLEHDLKLGWEATTDDQLRLYTTIHRTEQEEGKMDINSHSTAIYTPLNINYTISSNATIAEKSGHKYGQILVDGISIDLKTDVTKKIFNLSGQYSSENASIEASLIDHHGVPYTHKTVVTAELDRSQTEWTFPKSISLQSSTRKNAQPFVQIQANLSKQFNLSSSLLHIQAADNFDFHLQLTPYDDTMKSNKNLNYRCFNGKFSGYDKHFAEKSAYNTDEWKSLFPSSNLTNSDLTNNNSNSINYQLELQISAMLFNSPIKHCTLLHWMLFNSPKPILHLETKSYRPQEIMITDIDLYLPIDDETWLKMRDRNIYSINATYYHAEPEKPLWVKMTFGEDVAHAKLDVALFNPEKLVISLISDQVNYRDPRSGFLRQTTIQFYYKPNYRLMVHSKARQNLFADWEELKFNLSSNYCLLSSVSYDREYSSIFFNQFFRYEQPEPSHFSYKYQIELDRQSSQARLEIANDHVKHRTYFAIKNNSSYQLKTSTVKNFENIFTFVGNLRPASNESNLRIKVGHDNESYSSDISIHPEVNFHQITLQTPNLQHDSQVQTKDDLDGLGNYVLFKTSTRYEDVLLAALETRIGGKSHIELALLHFTIKADINAHLNQHQLTTITPALDEQPQPFYFYFEWNINDQSEDAVVSFEIDAKTILEVSSPLKQVTSIKAVFNQQQFLLKVTFLPNQELLLNNNITLLVAMDSLKTSKTEMHKSFSLNYYPVVTETNSIRTTTTHWLNLNINQKDIYQIQLNLDYETVAFDAKLQNRSPDQSKQLTRVSLVCTDNHNSSSSIISFSYHPLPDSLPYVYLKVYQDEAEIYTDKKDVMGRLNGQTVMRCQFKQLLGSWTANGSIVDLDGNKLTNFSMQIEQANVLSRVFKIKLNPWKNNLELSKLSVNIQGEASLSSESSNFELMLTIIDSTQKLKNLDFNFAISTQTDAKTGFTGTFHLVSDIFTYPSKTVQLSIKPSTEMVPLDGQLKIDVGPSVKDAITLATAVRLQELPKSNYTFDFTAANEDKSDLNVTISGAASEFSIDLMWTNVNGIHGRKNDSGSFTFSFTGTEQKYFYFFFINPYKKYQISGFSEYSDVEGPFGTTSKYRNILSALKIFKWSDFGNSGFGRVDSSHILTTESIGNCICTTINPASSCETKMCICPKLAKATNTVGISVTSSKDAFRMERCLPDTTGNTLNVFNATFQREPTKRSLNLQYLIESVQLQQSIDSLIRFSQPSIQVPIDTLYWTYITLLSETFAISPQFNENLHSFYRNEPEIEENTFWQLIIWHSFFIYRQLTQWQMQCYQSDVCKNPFNRLNELYLLTAEQQLENLVVKNHNFTIISSGKLFQFDTNIRKSNIFSRFLQNVQIIVQELFREAHYTSSDWEYFQDAAEQSAAILLHKTPDFNYISNSFFWNATSGLVDVNLCAKKDSGITSCV